MPDIKQEMLYNKPLKCEKCGASPMIFKGVGEYKCEQCGAIAYDDYGRVRLYIEQHKGATASQIEHAIGVSQRTIRNLLKEERIEVAPESKIYIRCEVCGVDIRSGRLCPACAAKRKEQADLEEAKEKKKVQKIQGYGHIQKNEEGAKRFKRER